MNGRRQCEFFLLRYVPDAVKDEFVNLGVVLYEPGEAGSGQAAFADVRFTGTGGGCAASIRTPTWRCWRRWSGRFASGWRKAAKPRVAAEQDGGFLLERYSADAGQGGAGGVAAGRDGEPGATVPGAGAARGAQGERAADGIRQDREQFERNWVWQFMRKGIAVAEYTHRGDPLKIDCGYAPQTNGKGGAPPRSDGRVKLFHAISLEADVNSAKVLAFSFPHLRAGIERSEQARAELTAIVEDDLERDDEGIGFALATLAGQEIAVATVAEMPAIAERARLELKLKNDANCWRARLRLRL